MEIICQSIGNKRLLTTEKIDDIYRFSRVYNKPTSSIPPEINLMRKVLIVAAHPDDEVLGCGALIAKHVKKGCEFYVLLLGEGTSCRYSDLNDPQIPVIIQERKKSFLKALGILGVQKTKIYDFKCGRFDSSPLIEITKAIEGVVNEFKSDTIFTHSSTDTNRDHTITFEATLIATRPAAATFTKSVLSYEVLSSTECQFEKAFTPNIFEEVDKLDVEKKWQALRCYGSEIKPFPHPRSREMIFGQAMCRGGQIGVSYAEAFKMIRERR